ncbi:unnamed protein product [Gongylonema pulchrum]|uniref:Uncharacterized protein n=1 Tax=Gongylonema pulchrum TaxID=637853 RepID=A0A3P6RNH5_9BILA|nr:unnamed protein product [Gongylonema pulchrum]
MLTNPDYHIAPAEIYASLITPPTDSCAPDTVQYNNNLGTNGSITLNWTTIDQTSIPILPQLLTRDTSHQEERYVLSSKSTIMHVMSTGTFHADTEFIHEIPSYWQWSNGDSVVLVPDVPDLLTHVTVRLNLIS